MRKLNDICYGEPTHRWRLVYSNTLSPTGIIYVNYYEFDPRYEFGKPGNEEGWLCQGLDYVLIDQKADEIVATGGNWFPLVALLSIELEARTIR